MSASTMTTYEVDPARLADGRWCHKRERQIGEGDIAAAYSGDTIALHGRVRKPFEFHGRLWTTIGNSRCGAKAYRLVHPSVFGGEATTYAEKVRDGDAARSDPNGSYHGMTVTHGGQTHVLAGPPAHFIPGETLQPDLFG